MKELLFKNIRKEEVMAFKDKYTVRFKVIVNELTISL